MESPGGGVAESVRADFWTKIGRGFLRKWSCPELPRTESGMRDHTGPKILLLDPSVYNPSTPPSTAFKPEEAGRSVLTPVKPGSRNM